ncbi:uncharacterized protein LOC125370501 [Ricinus communis]|uniref:uncharacterized protein LOC125370501 n=1 Tax=Ricinus communis TaxID=3988 RepID=UPI00201A4794|nr:uncharacterized protein LOC125370501 [Ricinus communis]
MESLIRNGKVTKKGSVMTCTVCGAKGHNKRFHGAGASTRREKLPVKRKTKKQQKEKESNVATTAAQNVDDQLDHVAPTDTAPLGTALTFDNLSPLIPLSQLFNVTSSTKESEKPAVHSTTSPLKPTSKKSKSINDLLSELPPNLAFGRLSQTQKGETEAKGKKTFKPLGLLSKDVGAEGVTTITKQDKEKQKIDGSVSTKKRAWVPPGNAKNKGITIGNRKKITFILVVVLLIY